MNVVGTTMGYFRERQTPLVLAFHLTVLSMVIGQIILSNFMGFTRTGEVASQLPERYGTWLHIGMGLLLVPISLIFLFAVIRHRGLRYYFPWLVGNVAPLMADLRTLLRLRMPEPGPGGLAAIMHGLGLGALLLVVFSGFTWFISWSYHLPWAPQAGSVHALLTGLIEAYIIGHGAMGILHIFFRSRFPSP
ncbi:cytochrome b/b6 domain-containing protein [Modicisalibacter sp. 'Wilcox']|uniref:cytochrome b/b6 domain-containing protein n=1 Tax=Modicisalibacter sp. 'Wilcox' TaxID=2679914 RepID=UPI00079974DE|nr:cytochrome b/b6 domain-containing protein [Modicisalibacter sp. 'Wilcox']KXS38912.1 MAG: hypothetical protein AWU55_1007 [Halomonadaceae bacterium T82-2]